MLSNLQLFKLHRRDLALVAKAIVIAVGVGVELRLEIEVVAG